MSINLFRLQQVAHFQESLTSLGYKRLNISKYLFQPPWDQEPSSIMKVANSHTGEYNKYHKVYFTEWKIYSGFSQPQYHSLKDRYDNVYDH